MMSRSTGRMGVQGLTNINDARSCARRAFWAIFVIIGILLFVWQVTMAVAKFYSYPVNTRTVQHTARVLDFPAITFCNLNPLRQSVAKDEKGDAGKEFMGLANKEKNGKPDSDRVKPKKFPSNDDDWDDGELANYDDATDAADAPDEPDPYDRPDFEADTDDYATHKRFENFYSHLSRKQRSKSGHQLKAMLLSCTWNGRACNSRNFTQFNNYLYGNCFTFNSDRKTSVRSSLSGPLYGLKMRLFVEQFEYIESLSDSAGVRVVVHNQSMMPFPEDDGFSVNPGTKTAVGIRMNTITRMGKPYQGCANYTSTENKKLNGYISAIKTIGYSARACRKTCFQHHLMEECGCYNARFPFGDKIEAYEPIDVAGMLPCDSGSHTKHERDDFVRCKNKFESRIKFGNLRCSDACLPMCSEVFYSYSISQSAWPSVVKENALFDQLYMRSPFLWKKMRSLDADQQSDFVKSNVLAVDIYFETFRYEELFTEASYVLSDMLSDIGGQGGLWLGVSVVVLWEMLSILLDFFVFGVCCLARPRQRSNAARKRPAPPVIPLKRKRVA